MVQVLILYGGLILLKLRRKCVRTAIRERGMIMRLRPGQKSENEYSGGNKRFRVCTFAVEFHIE